MLDRLHILAQPRDLEKPPPAVHSSVPSIRQDNKVFLTVC